MFQEHKRSTPRCNKQGQYHTTFCASTTRWTHHKHPHPIQQSHSNFKVAIKRSACSRGLVMGLTNTSCCGVCSVQPHRKCWRKMADASTARQEVRVKVFSKNGRRSREVLSPFGGAYWETIFLGQKNADQFTVCARFAHHKLSN